MTLSLVPITLSDAKGTHLSEWFIAHPNACGSDVAMEILSRLSPRDATDIRAVARSYCTDEQRQYITTGFIWRGLLTLERNGQVERSRTSRSFKWRLRRSDSKRCHVCGLPRKGHARDALTGGIRCMWCGLQVASNEDAPWSAGTPTASGWYQVKWEASDGPTAILITVITDGAVWSYGVGDDPEMFPGSDAPNPQWRFVCPPELVQ